MVKDHIKSAVGLLVLNILAYLLHYYLIIPSVELTSIPVLNIQLSYLINAAASISMCSVIYLLKKSFESQIGFIFLGLSAIKMILLFVLLDPTNELGTVAKADALAFFVPFGLNLVTELIFIVKMLKISDLAKELQKK
ncbi:hypothetical protein AXE80_14035 [Wenyingzhuangia fucanilytica]|uniref:Uncharacterized protein n=1 Tax=Wenyingzhuangia fucanilytica TaxID=1790137 RepID=A0A1B1Y9B5_9FLAO|nr:hypothetical protein [Wenyingzhuangia fucanilytica]ANW97345.1 hypothetical protein AXE80_14035 [Wenyingzhuangia fucanilytica]